MANVERPIEVLNRFSEWVGRCVAFLVVAYAAMLVIEVISRYAFNHPTAWAHELSTYLFGAYFMLGGAYCVLHRSHVTVDVLYSRVPFRMRVIILDSIACIFILLVCTVLVWHGGELAWKSLLEREYTSSMVFRIPMYPRRLIVPLAGVLIGMQALANLVRDIHAAVKR